MSLTEEIKQRLDIVDVIGEYVSLLQKAGRNYKALCPFHTEKTPSFVIFPDRQSWRCFGACAMGGDVFTFVMEKEKITFSDTLKQLANKAGVTVPERRAHDQHQTLFQINEAAAAFFQELIKSQKGASARKYLEGRGVEVGLMDRFQLGLSPIAGNHLLEHLKSLGFSEKEVLDVGLSFGEEGGRPRGRFRGRLMIPIRDDQGNLVGFGGRSLDGSDPKYLNSPRTVIFDKGRILYLFDKARKNIRQKREGVVVEGYMDAIAAHGHGFDNVVASMGTAVTDAQVRLLAGTAHRFVLALDPDAAGQEATRRSLEGTWRMFEQRVMAGRRGVTLYERPSEISIKIAVLPPGDDPDKVIRENPERWDELVQNAMLLPDYILAKSPEWWDLSTSEGKRQTVATLFPFFQSMENPFDREKYTRLLAERLETTPETLSAIIGKPNRRPVKNRGLDNVSDIQVSALEKKTQDPLEEYLLGMILRWPELKEATRKMSPSAFHRPEHREAFILWWECSTIEELYKIADEELKERIEIILAAPFPPTNINQREEAVRQCVHRMEERYLKEMKAEEALILTQNEPAIPDQGTPDLNVDVFEQRMVDTNERLRHLFDANTQTKNRE